MNCDGVIRHVSSYIDGELGAAVVEEIELHLRDCPDCTIFVRQTKLTVSMYHDLDLVDLPSDVSARLHETLRRKIREARK